MELSVDGGVCARFENGSVQCAALDRSATEPWSPKASSLHDWKNVAGMSGNCAWLSDGSLKCEEGTVSCGSAFVYFRSAAEASQHQGHSCSPMGDWIACTRTVACASAERLRGVAFASAGGQVCARLAGGEVNCVDPFAAEPVTIAAARGALSLHASRWQSCAILPSRMVECWQSGNGWYLENESQLAAARSSEMPVYLPAPKLVENLANVVALDVGDEHSCAVLQDHTVRCWGQNYRGQLGDGTKEDRLTPVAVQGLKSAVEVRVGNTHSCARLIDGSVSCWGDNGAGEIARTGQDYTRPMRVAAIADAAQIVVSGPVTCALSKNQEVVCWGCRAQGRCGLGYTEEQAKIDRKIAQNACSAPVRVAWLP